MSDIFNSGGYTTAANVASTDVTMESMREAMKAYRDPLIPRGTAVFMSPEDYGLFNDMFTPASPADDRRDAMIYARYDSGFAINAPSALLYSTADAGPMRRQPACDTRKAKTGSGTLLLAILCAAAMAAAAMLIL